MPAEPYLFRLGRRLLSGLAHLPGETGWRNDATLETGSTRNGRRPSEIALGPGSRARAAGVAVHVEIFAAANGVERGVT